MKMMHSVATDAEYARFIPLRARIVDYFLQLPDVHNLLVYDGEFWMRYDPARQEEVQATTLYLTLLEPPEWSLAVSYWKEDKT